MYCDVHAVGQQSQQRKCLFTTFAMATNKHATMDNHATVEATSVFFVVCPEATMGQPCFLCGLFPGYITNELQGRGQLSVKWSDGKGCHKRWLQSWSQSLQRKSRDSVVVSCKVIECTVLGSNNPRLPIQTRRYINRHDIQTCESIL
jgi:hypothetical protein